MQLRAGLVIGSSLLCSFLQGGEVRVEAVPGKHARLFAGSGPFVVQGAGGGGSRQLLREAGGNSFRTWKIDESTGEQLEEAARLGLKVTLGFWLGHERHGFSYESFEQVAKQEDLLREAVRKYRDHPALLMWAIGNEAEGFGDGGSPAIWTQIEHLARAVKSIDPLHPVMTITAGIGGERIKAINRFCPSIDIHGINCYGGIETLPERYRASGGTRPYLVTEFGPRGVWESGTGKWGMPIELSSTEKAESYRKAWKTIDGDPLCLGGYAFYWGAKQETTATWFGLLLPDGEVLGGVDALTREWTGKAPVNTCPRIAGLQVAGGNRELAPGEEIQLHLDVSDPDGDSLATEWVLTEDWKELTQGGDTRPSPPRFPEAILKASPKEATVRMPENGGTYRLYVFVRDGNGAAATASVSLQVKGPYLPGGSREATLPFEVTSHYVASGWMGDTDKMKLTHDCRENPKEGGTCLKLAFTEPAGWGGIVWQSPAGDWGDQPGGFDLSGASTLQFWARGEKGGEKATFGMGIIEEDRTFHDTARVSVDLILSPDWKQYSIDLRGEDLSRIKSGFFIVTESHGLPLEVFVDEVIIK